jgi:hypothetical protein
LTQLEQTKKISSKQLHHKYDAVPCDELCILKTFIIKNALNFLTLTFFKVPPKDVVNKSKCSLNDCLISGLSQFFGITRSKKYHLKSGQKKIIISLLLPRSILKHKF